MTTNTLEAVVDLWPEDLELDDIVPPVTILKQQAVLLGKKTKNLLEGQVTTFSAAGGMMGSLSQPLVVGGSGKFSITNSAVQTTLFHNFDLVASTLNGYKYTLFSASHNINMYPVSIAYDDQRIECSTEQEFLQALKSIFNSDETRRVISALIAQSKA